MGNQLVQLPDDAEAVGYREVKPFHHEQVFHSKGVGFTGTESEFVAAGHAYEYVQAGPHARVVSNAQMGSKEAEHKTREVSMKTISDQDQTKSISLRTQALALLEQAQAIDGLKPFVVMHDHEYGTTGYLCWSGHEPDEEQAEAVLEADFDPDRGERLTIVDSLTLAELAGVAVSSRLAATEPQEGFEIFRGVFGHEGTELDVEFVAKIGASKAEKDSAYLDALAQQADVNYVSVGDTVTTKVAPAAAAPSRKPGPSL